MIPAQDMDGRRIECPACGSITTYRRANNDRSRPVEYDPDQPFRCDKCGETFGTDRAQPATMHGGSQEEPE